jgi:hypothetical protein
MYLTLAGICFALAYVISRNTPHDLSKAKIGSVYDFEYLQPVDNYPKSYTARVTKVRELTDAELYSLDTTSPYRWWDLIEGRFYRTPHLVTAQSSDGKIRNFYAQRTRNVKKRLFGMLPF